MTSGRQPLYDCPDDMQDEIDEYFDNPPTKTLRLVDGSTVDIPFVSITGLTLALGFCNHKSFYDYEKKPLFTDVVKRARTRIENEYEFKLQFADRPQAAMFALKKLGWSDRTAQFVDFDLDKDLNAHQQSAQILDNIAKGNVSVEVGIALIGTIKSIVDIEETTELAERISELEKSMGLNG